LLAALLERVSRPPFMHQSVGIVTVTGSLAKDGTKLVNARKITLADGTQVVGASSQGGEAK